LGPEFEVLASWPVLIVAGVLLVVEIVADKIPAVDHVWDTIHTFIRTPGAMVVIGVMMQGEHMTWQVIAILVAGGVSFVAHSGKATTRAASTKTTAATANAVVSGVEDVFVILGSLLAAFYPVLLGALVLVLLILAALFGPKLLRSARINWAVATNFMRYLWAKLRRWIDREWRPREKGVRLPTALRDLALAEEPVAAVRVLEGPYGRRRFAHLVLWRDRLALSVRRLVKPKVLNYYYKELDEIYVGENTLLDRLYFAARGREYVISFFKGRQPTAGRAAELIGAGRVKP
jgi:hypothetical protein